MNCEQCIAQIDLILDGEHENFESSSLDQHLLACPDCQAFRLDRALLKQKIKLLLTTNEADLAQTTRILESLKKHEKGQKQQRLAVWVGVAATIAILIFTMWTVRPEQSHLASLSLTNIAQRYQEHIDPGDTASRSREKLEPIDLKSLARSAGYVVATRPIRGFVPAAMELIADADGLHPIVHFCYQPQTEYKDCIDCYQVDAAHFDLNGLRTTNTSNVQKTADGRYTIVSGSFDDKSVVALKGADQQLFISKLPPEVLLELIKGRQTLSLKDSLKVYKSKNLSGIIARTLRI